jgi:chromosome segregation ATPase
MMNHDSSIMRVYAPLEEQTVSELDQVAEQKGFSRAQMIIKAVYSYLHQPETSTEDLDQIRIKLDQVNSELDQTKFKLDQSIAHATNLGNELELLKTTHKQSTVEDTKRWEELKGIRSENTKLKKDLDAAQATIQRLQAELLNKQTEIDQVVGLKVELAKANTEAEKLREALKSRDEDVEWLKSHVAQLTQQLALPPSEEEVKAKHWYQFWR